MQINKEQTDQHSIQSYSESQIKINSVIYQTNLIVSASEVIENWPAASLSDLNEKTLQPLLIHHPEVILIGHNQLGVLPPLSILQFLSQKQIGMESMDIGAACRTFNVLLSEKRRVVLGILF